MSLRLEMLPALNAALNGLATILLVTGYAFIRARRAVAHKVCMLAATSASILFLISYLYYHSHAGITRFQGTGLARAVYFTILISHTILAAAVPPLVIITLTLAFSGRLSSHRRIARWTLPIWLYVSITGVLVYFMLYHLFPSNG